MSATYSYTCVEVTTSNVPSAKGRSVASPGPNVTWAGASRPAASDSMSWLGSMPVTEPDGPTAEAISQARKPGPEPMSRTRSPGCNDSAPTMMRRCSTTSGVV